MRFKVLLLLVSIIFLAYNNIFCFETYELKGLRDPFLIPLKNISELEQEDFFKTLPFPVEIKGVVMQGGKKYVIINQDIIEENESWKGLIVKEITQKYLVVEYNNRKVKIFINNPE